MRVLPNGMLKMHVLVLNDMNKMSFNVKTSLSLFTIRIKTHDLAVGRMHSENEILVHLFVVR